MFYGLIDMMMIQRLFDASSYKSAVFTSDVEVTLIRKKNLFPVFGCPGFMFFGPTESFYSWSEIGRTNLIVHRDITSYNPTSFDNTLMLSPRQNG